jgi:cysteine-rich repeat protein
MANSDTAPDACRTDCTFARCGDGALDTGEGCDDGNDDNTDSCPDGAGGTCVAARCGDGFVDSANETCDDGNSDNTDDCPDGFNGTCQTAFCGDGIVLTTTSGTAEECDDGGMMDNDGCSAMCTNEGAAVCGDGIPQAGEECDDGNGNDDDDCLTSCAFARCGDGYVNANGTNTEGCDDGNGILADGCPDGPLGTCQPATCGDTFQYLSAYGGTEECDDGNMAIGDGCDDSCQLEATMCPNAMVDPGEECDLGMGVNSDTTSGACPAVCRTDCTCPTCGDGVTDYALGEECDDWNMMSGDGCSSACLIEAAPTCGDGALDTQLGEQCDDGNNAPGDGCSPTCQFELIGATCGDTTMDTLEVCDDGMQCADGTACTGDGDCAAVPVPPNSDNLCLTRNHDGCNTTCNFKGEATLWRLPASGALSLAVDTTYLWMADESTGVIDRVDIDACITALANAQSCTFETVLTGINGAANMTTDGSTLWFATANYQVSGPYIGALDIAACEATGLPCNGVQQLVAGTTSWAGYSDGVGTNAAIAGLRALTYYNGYVYFLDGGFGTMRRFDPLTGAVLTIVGPTMPGGPSNAAVPGYGNAARLESPRYMTADNSGFLYMTDNADHRIWRYNINTGYLDPWVGDGTVGYADDIDGTMAQLNRPRDLTSDGTSIYWAAFNSYTVRQADILTSRVTTLLGQPNVCGNMEGTGANAVMGKPWGMVYHYPTGSLFTSWGADPFTMGCTNLPAKLWRIE